MAYQRLQVSEGLAVIPSNTVKIPDPATKVTSGTTGDASVASAFTDAAGTFVTDGVQVGAIIYATSKAYYVLEVTNNTTLVVSVGHGVIAGSSTLYTIYNAATKACTLYVGSSGSLVVEMASNRDQYLADGSAQPDPSLTFIAAPGSAFLPLLVTKVGVASTASNIVALW